MLFTVASAGWSPGLPLTPAQARAGLFRTREAVARVAAGRPIVGVALRFDEVRGVVVAQPPASRALIGRWSAPAIANDSGGVTLLSTVPEPLVRLVGRPHIRIHRGHGAPSADDPEVAAGSDESA